MNRAELAPRPLAVLSVRGSQREMGAQIGSLFRALGGYEDVATFYPTMAARMLALGLPHRARKTGEGLARLLLAGFAQRMHSQRCLSFPEYAARTDAMLESGGMPQSMAASLLVMEVLQNTVGLLGKAGMFRLPALSPIAIPACSSVALWGAASADGTLLHARNFDFPGAGVWDHAPALIFCDPDEGHRYGFATTRGADLPGITAFNEHGLTLTVHTRFHREVRFDRAPVFDLGHEIVRSASTLAEAADVARKLGSASTWGLLVSSAKEKSACLIETTGERVVVSEPSAGRSFQSCTNRYIAKELQSGEITTSRAFTADSNARFARLERTLLDSDKGLGADDLEILLCDLCAEGTRDKSSDTERLAGDCIMSPISVQSIVAEPEREQIRVSVGRAPSGFGPYVQVPWAFHGRIEAREIEVDKGPIARCHRGSVLSPQKRALVREYVAVSRLHFEGASPKRVRAEVEALVARAPREPHFRALAAFVAMGASDLESAAHHLEQALSEEAGERRRARLLLFSSRVQHLLGHAAAAQRARAELLALDSDDTAAERHAARTEATRPLTRKQLARLVVDFLLIDAAVPGALA